MGILEAATPGASYWCPDLLLKRFHIGNPAVIVSSFIWGPLAVFYFGILIAGDTVANARSDGWMYYETERSEFWNSGPILILASSIHLR